jgi:hypothetical protein
MASNDSSGARLRTFPKKAGREPDGVNHLVAFSGAVGFPEWERLPRERHLTGGNEAILGKSRMRKRARTDLCGGRPAMVVPTVDPVHGLWPINAVTVH